MPRCPRPADGSTGRKARDAGKSGPGCCHSHPVPTDFQPEEIGCKRKGKAAHALPQSQKAIVDPCMGKPNRSVERAGSTAASAE